MAQPTALLTKFKPQRIALGVAALAAIVALGVAPASTNALSLNSDKTDVGLGISQQSDDGDRSHAGLRVLSEDGIENVGVQSLVGTTSDDGDETQLGTKTELTDDLENISTNVSGMTKDNDGDTQHAGLNLHTMDNLDTVKGNVMGSSHNNGDTTTLNLPFNFED